MGLLSTVKGLFVREGKTVSAEERGYGEAACVGGSHSDWILNYDSEDADVWKNSKALLSRMRDGFKQDVNYIAYRENFWSQVYGAKGHMMRSRVKEEEDRVVYSDEEKHYLEQFENRRNRVYDYYAKKRNEARSPYLAYTRAHGNNGSQRAAHIKVGDPDLYARARIESGWNEWQDPEFCDVRQQRSYQDLRLIRGITAVRDGEVFIRMIFDPTINKFGFSLQLINAEWVDMFYNDTLPSGNVVRMGIEYEWSRWGLGKVVAYYFLKRQPKDWQGFRWGGSGLFDFKSGELHDRIEASEIIHLARPVDAEGTRPAPWMAATIGQARALTEYEKAEVIAARGQACITGWLTSTIMAEGGVGVGRTPDPTKVASMKVKPGGIYALPYGIEHKDSNPTHPGQNFPEFQKATKRSIAAGMPGGDYSTLANDYEAVSFSAARLSRLDSQEKYMLLQEWEIKKAEAVIFKNFLKQALAMRALGLPSTPQKIRKFSAVTFQGRRWQGVDELKEVNASALRVANHLSSDARECADDGNDFEEIMFEQAECNMIKEQFNIPVAKTVENRPTQQGSSEDTTQAAENASIQGTALNGAQVEALLSIIDRVTLGEIDIDTATSLISAAFPLMEESEISQITDGLKTRPRPTVETETEPTLPKEFAD